ncbi:hypothetical protein LUZ60_016283 [Juncus effusus]|nr:hypothetical protein LUZ60_016283 [Juncus effusus]
MTELFAPDPPGEGSLVGYEGAKITIAVYTIITAVALVLAHLIIITQFRLWHTNFILEKIPQLVSSPISQILTQGIGLIAVVPYRNDLYLIWLVVLLIAYDNVFTISGYTLLEKGSERLSREYLFLTNCVFIGALVTTYNKENASAFYQPLLALWSLVVLKFIVRLVSYSAAEKAYGIKNTNLVADYMETEHTLSGHTDPITMKGYKYLVIGEEKARPLIKPPLYTLEFDKTQDEVVTVERVWECKEGLLNIDEDERIRGICLSFALFKLVRRRFFGFRAAESEKPKTKDFVLRGLLSRNKAKVFRVIDIELAFLRDFFYTRYPVAFAFGFPIFNVLLLVAMFAISLWISTKAFQEKRYTNYNAYNYLIVNKKNVDYRITNGLLIIIMVMEIFEVLSFVFSDWMKVTLISGHVRSKKDENIPFINEMLRLFCKPKLSKSLKNTIGQYSLLKSYSEGGCKRVTNNFIYRMTCAMLASKIPRGMVADKSIVLPEEVKVAVFDALETSGGNFDDRLAPLRRNGVNVQDLPLFTFLQKRPLHTIMVWHIATSLCEIRPLMNQPIIDDANCLFSCITNCVPSFLWKRSSPEEEAIQTHHLVASSLSKYCAYLLLFAPELLPTSTYSSKRIFDKIVLETSDFFKSANGPKEQYERMMEYTKNADEGQEIVEKGAELARYLMEKKPDDVERWKLMADVWSELILFLAPSGATSGHLEKLSSGGEFITHLWTLLYHAGIVVSVSEEFEP